MQIVNSQSSRRGVLRPIRAVLCGGAVLVVLAFVSGCTAPQPETPEVAPPPPVAPAADSTPENSAAREAHQVVTEYTSKANVTYTLSINGATVGSYSTDKVQNDISSSLRDGTNEVKIAWTADPSMPSYGSARFKLQTQRDGKWNDVITREVRRDTAAGETTVNLQVGAPPPVTDGGTAPSEGTVTPDSSTTPLPEATIETAGEGGTVAGSTPAASAVTIADRYILKTTFNSLARGTFNVSVNGQTVGSYDSVSNQDISSFLKPGPNTVMVSWEAAAPIKNQFAESKLTIGVFRDNKWSTVANQTINKSQPQGNRTWQLDVR